MAGRQLRDAAFCQGHGQAALAAIMGALKAARPDQGPHGVMQRLFPPESGRLPESAVERGNLPPTY